MKLIFAQGNPGKQHERTRHNIGWRILDSLAKEQGGTWRKESKFNAEIAEITLAGEKALLVKPLSFYNDTGLVARSLVDFYKLTPTSDLLVLHDELALPFGTLRIREKGSDAGNNGIKSLNTHLGQGYARLRLGIWNERRDLMGDADFVLSAFSKDESGHIETAVTPAAQAIIEQFARGQLQAHSHTTV